MSFYVRKRLVCLAATLMLAGAAFSAHAAVWEKYLLVIPLRPGTEQAQKMPWFGRAFRLAWSQASMSLKTLVFLKEDELEGLSREYRLGPGEPEPGQMERIADDKEIAVLFGTYDRNGRGIRITCRLIPGRNEEARSFSLQMPEQKVGDLLGDAIRQSLKILDLEVTPEARAEIGRIPGTQSLAALEYFTQAVATLGSQPDPRRSRAVLPLLEKSLKADPAFASALALQATCRLLSSTKPVAQKEAAEMRRKLTAAAKDSPGNPWMQNALLELLLEEKKYAEAVRSGEAVLASHPMNYRNYLLLARAYRLSGRKDDAEKVLLRALDQQGTPSQQEPFQDALGHLLLRTKDDHAEIYLKDVLLLRPADVEARFQRAAALFRLGRYLDALEEIQKTEALKKWSGLSLLKAKTTLALGNYFLEKEEPDRAYSYLTVSIKLRPRNFETNLLLAKVLRQKGYAPEARQQLERTRNLANPKRGRDHLLLGTEYVAQGYKEEGAQEFVRYLKQNPSAPERRRLITLIRKLRGESEEGY